MTKFGVAFCRGHAHHVFNITIPDDIIWTYVDTDPRSNPDIVGNMYSIETIMDLGLDEYDYVTETGCPFHHDINQIKRFLRSVHPLLKKGGKVLIRHMFDKVLKLSYPQFFKYEIPTSEDDLSSATRAYLNGELPKTCEELNKLLKETWYSAIEVYILDTPYLSIDIYFVK